jgi:hypothetical protein
LALFFRNANFLALVAVSPCVTGQPENSAACGFLGRGGDDVTLKDCWQLVFFSYDS